MEGIFEIYPPTGLKSIQRDYIALGQIPRLHSLWRMSSERPDNFSPVFSQIESKISDLGDLYKRPDEKLHQLGILYEEMNLKIDTALEVSVLTTQQQAVSKRQEERLKKIETDLRILKLVLSHSKA